MMRSALAAVLLLCLATPSMAAFEVILGWERPVRFAVVDAETGKPVARPLLIVATEKVYEGATEPVTTNEVLRGSDSGTVDYKASERTAGVELRVTAPGYEYLVKQVDWKQLPPRRQDEKGRDIGPVAEITVELRNLERGGEWQRAFRLNIRPSLEEYLSLPPHAMSRPDRKLIRDFIDRQENRLLGF